MKKVAIIGAGQVAELVHAHYYKSRPDELALVAVVDSNMEKGAEFCQKTGFKKSYQDINDMLKQEKPDLVSVCTPNRFHFEAVMKSLDAGASVICEKPPAMTAEEAKKMANKAEEKGAVLAYDFQHRFSSETKFLKKYFSKLGQVYFTQATALRRSGVPGWGSFIDKQAQGGGPLIDYGIHMLDTALYILNYPEIKSVTAHEFQKIGTKKSSGKFGEWDPEKFTVEDSLFGVIEFRDGSILRIDTSFALNIKEDTILTVNFHGDEAGASLYPGEIYHDEAGELKMIAEMTEVEEDKHWKSMEAFVNRALGDISVDIADGKQGYLLQLIIEKLYQSAEVGATIEL